MHVRRIRSDEWRALRDLRLRALEADPAAFGATLEEERAFPDEKWQRRAASETIPSFVAQTGGGRLVGLAAARPEDDGAVELVGMWVAPEARGTGVAGALIAAVTEWARERAAPRVTLWVNAANERAQRVYARHGFTPVQPPERGTRDPTRWFVRMARAP